MIAKETHDAFVTSKMSEMTEEDIYDYVEEFSQTRNPINRLQSSQNLPLKLRSKVPTIATLINNQRK